METTTRSETPAGAGKSSLNPDALNQLLGQMVNDLGAAVNGALVVLGDGLGIYTTLADIGPATSRELAKKTNLHERQLREWLSAQAASGYVSYDAASEAFFLTAEQVAVFADPNSPAAMTGGFYAISAIHLTLKARVPGTDQATFEALAAKAKAGCPISKVLKADITLAATLVN